MALPFTVRLDGKPLAGAIVALTPAPFLGEAILPAGGTTNQSGAGSLEMPADNRPSHVPRHLPLMQPGLYSVEITHPSVEIPDRYNTETTLGLEAGVAAQNPAGQVWNLSSKKK